jgi:hypothetical protein
MEWRGYGRKASLVAWKKVSRSKMKGGLGVIKLRVQNEALLLKQISISFSTRLIYHGFTSFGLSTIQMGNYPLKCQRDPSGGEEC